MAWQDVVGLLEYFLQLIVQLAWPIVAIFAIVVFKPQITAIMGAIESLKFPGGEARFRNRVRDASKEAERLPETETERDAQKEEAFSEFQEEDFLALSPRATVLESWLAIEMKLREMAGARDIPSGPKVATSRIIRDLRQRGTLSEGLVRLLDDLRKLRNEAVHVPDATISRASAAEYSRSCAKALNWISRRQPSTDLEEFAE